MATIDYKEKYEQAMERARQFIEKPYLEDSAGIVRHIFPELAESEDERIRKSIIEHLKSDIDDMSKSDCAFDYEAEIEELSKYIAWLKVQDEQKPIDKIQLGKKYKCIASPRYSAFITGKIYKPEDKFLCSLMNLCSDCFEPIEDCEQKPAEWSKEDESVINKAESWLDTLCDYLKDSSSECIPDIKDVINKLKSFKDKYTWKPSDEQMDILQKLCEHNSVVTLTKEGIEAIESLYQDLKKLRGE